MASSSSKPPEEPLMSFSCYQCRNRKLKCDRSSPGCSRCSATGTKCQYPSSRKKPVITATRPRVKELESRLVDLEYRLKATQEEGYQSFRPFEPSENQLTETGRYEQLPPQEIIEELRTNVFFTEVHCDAQYIHPSRYLASLYLPPHMQPPMCLQYIIMARAALVSPPHKHLADPLYRRARYYLEADEQKGEGEYFVTLAHTQCCLLMSHFEVLNMWFSRSSMSTSKSVRLSQILGLHQLDGKNDWRRNATLPEPKDWCELEERRRTLWAVFCSDKHTSGTTGWPSLMDANKISTLLPASDEAFQLGMEEPSTSLPQVLGGDNSLCSSFAYRITTTHLFHECLDHTYQEHQSSDLTDIQNGQFWKRHRDLDTSLSTAFITLPEKLRGSHTQEATNINLQLHTASICIHRVGAVQAKKHNIPADVLSNTQARLVPSADAIFNMIASQPDVTTMFGKPLVTFAAYMATYVFLEDYVSAQNRTSEMKMTALMDLMITIGRENPVTASAAIQMAHELRKTGIDASAVDKVQSLMERSAKGPLLGQQNTAEGTVLFCPFEGPSGPAPPGVPSEILMRGNLSGFP
ncbi:Zn(II)2Cys6 transcriptional activator [Fusarium agapanthi]|uniref:Zn(II)2Cys6 transcriptional activator n=1 Tax=Fusarium agapanthi TaxID=1803897 RepID=A0A9P5B5A4_9HYPO|nr:Zn(II)2Cys6 transcriptional activator [Fusarium agapanthi]